MLSLKHRGYLESMVLHSKGGFTHQTLAHALIATNGHDLQSTEEVVQDCLELCQDLEQRGLLERKLQQDGHFYFSH